MPRLSRSQVAGLSGALLLVALAAHVLRLLDGGTATTIATESGVSVTASAASVVQDVALVLAALVAGVPTAIGAWRALRARAFSIDLLVTIAVVGALVIGERVEAGVVAFLFVAGAWLEARTLARARGAVAELLDLSPRTADVRRGEDVVTVPVDDLAVGDLVVARRGTRVAVDGTVVSGLAHVDASALTGEPIPVEVGDGDRVLSGAVVDNGYLEIRADQVGEETTFSRIIELVLDAQDSSTRTQRFLDRFAAIYTPAIIVGAVLVGLIGQDVRPALTFLVIACPGALVISAPVSMVAGLGNGARHGILAKGGDALERLARIDTVVLDKTGTLTVGRPQVVAVVPAPGRDEDDLLARAATLEQASEHPLGRAIVAAAAERGLTLGPVPERVDVLAGAGIAAGGLAVGSRRLLDDAAAARARIVTPGIPGTAGIAGAGVGADAPGSGAAGPGTVGPRPARVPESDVTTAPIGVERSLADAAEHYERQGATAPIGVERSLADAADRHERQDATAPIGVDRSLADAAMHYERQGATVSWVVADGEVLGLLAIADRVRPEAADAVAALRAQGVERIVMLTGDNRHAAEHIGAQVGVDEVRAGLLPADKVASVQELRDTGAAVLMVGDGINDAPAIATADLGIAMGGGADVSVEAAEIVLPGDRLDTVAHGRALARATVRNVRQNTVLALATVALLLTGVLLGEVHMAGGMLVHQGSVLLVVLNAVRLISFRPRLSGAVRVTPETGAPSPATAEREDTARPGLAVG